MWSSDRRRLLGLLATLPMAACGFTPAFGPKGPARGLLGKVQVDDPHDKNGFDLVGELQQRLGRPQAPEWRLSYTITTQEIGLGVTTSNAITRYDITGTISYSLRRIDAAPVVASGNVRDFTSYSASGTALSTATSQRDAYQRLMTILADQIVTELIASSPGWAAR